ERSSIDEIRVASNDQTWAQSKPTGVGEEESASAAA
ncbi:hypothetical protein THAOC_08027, partial [Thalassiosira oceanica]